MPILLHVALAVSYTAVALSIALVLPARIPVPDAGSFGLAGGIFWVACAVSHEVFARLRQQVRVAGQITDQKTAYRRVMDELSGARAQIRLIQEALDAASRKRNRKAEREIKEVVDEVQVLRRLVEQLTTGTDSAGRASRAGPGGAPEVEESLEQSEILDIVRDGLKSDRVDLYLQPIVSLPQRRRRYLECFSRIRTPDGTMVVPGQYLDLAEKAGLISAIDNMLLFRCVQLVRRSQQRRFNLGFFYNISPHTLADREFFAEFIDFMIQNEELAPNLIFEFAQADLAGHDQAVTAELGRLAEYGFHYSLDRVTDLDLDCADLARRHFSFVKVEGGRLLSRLAEVGGDVDVRDLKARLGRSGIDLVAEKIETEPMLVELLDFDIDYGQGYLFGEPRLSREP